MTDLVKLHVQKALESGSRMDGRKIDEYRPISVETGIIRSAEGSARVKIGDTEVIAGVKMSIETPYPDTPDSGNLMVNVELLPLSSPDYESGPPGEEAVETARVIDRGIRESHAIDMKNLVIESGEKVWGIAIDIVTINVDGNLFDAAGLAALAAIKTTKFPAFDEETGKIDYKTLTDTPLPVSQLPIPITVYKCGKALVIDPTDEESKTVEARLTAAVIEDGRLCAMQKGGEAAISNDELKKMLDLIQKKSAELRKIKWK